MGAIISMGLIGTDSGLLFICFVVCLPGPARASIVRILKFILPTGAGTNNARLAGLLRLVRCFCALPVNEMCRLVQKRKQIQQFAFARTYFEALLSAHDFLQAVGSILRKGSQCFVHGTHRSGPTA